MNASKIGDDASNENKNERSLPEEQDELSPCIEKEKDSQKEEVCSDMKDTSSTSGNTEVLPSSGVKEEVIPKLEKKEDASPSEEKKNISSSPIADNQEDFSEADVSNGKKNDSSLRDNVGEDSKDKPYSAISTASITTTSVTKVSVSSYEENIVVSSCSETNGTSEKDANSESTATNATDEVEQCIADNEETGPKSGVLEVKVIEGSELEDKDIPGRSDPFVVLKFKEEKFKSQTVNNSLEPQWNFTANLEVSEDDSNSIEFSVFDDDIVGNSYSAPQLLGSCSVSIKDALSQLGKAKWYPLQGVKSGKISVSFEFTADQESDEESSFEMVEEDKEVKEEVVEEKVTQIIQESVASSSKTVGNQKTKDTVDDSSLNKSEPRSGVLEVKVNEAKELENKAMLGKSDPYVFIQFEDSKFQSQTVNSNLAPKWSFSTNLNISEDNTNSIQFSVFDDNYGKDQLLGSCSVPVREALQLANKEEQWMPLEGCKSGMISVSFKFTEDEEESCDQDEEKTDVKDDGKSGDETGQKDGESSSDKEDEEESCPEPEREKKEVVEEDMVYEKNDEVTAEKIEEKVSCEGENADIDSPTDNGLTQIEKAPSKTSLLAHQVKSFDSIDGDSPSHFTGDVSQRRSSADEAQKGSSSNETSGFMANLKGSIGGFFFKQEEKEKVDEEKNEEVPVPREFVMESNSDSVDGNCLLTKKQPENLKDIPIMEENEPAESENEDFSSKVSSIPHEPAAQSEKSQDGESNKSKTVCGADDAKKSFNLDKELNEIEFIISNLFGVLEELSESVGCSKNIQEMKVELDTIRQSAANLGSSASPEDDIAAAALSLETAVLKAKACGAELKKCPVSEETFDKLVAACQQVSSDNRGKESCPDEEEETQQTLVSAGEIAEPEEEGTNSDNAILSKEKTEGIGKLETAVIEERVPSWKAAGCESADESSREDKYHFNTPPTISTESEILACGINLADSTIKKNTKEETDEDETQMSKDSRA